MNKEGFSFQILNQAFLVSRGFKTKSRMTEDEKRVRDDFKQFKQDFSSALIKFGYTDPAYEQC